MKNFIRILFMVLLVLPTAANAQIAAFERFADSKGVAYFYISETMLQMASKYGKSAAKDNPLTPIIDKLTTIQEVRTTNKDNGNKLVKEVKEIANSDKYNLLVSIDKPAERRFVYFKPKDQKHPIASVIIIKSSSKETVAIAITGHLDPDDLTSIIR